jgi:hypothetical protein
MAQAPHVPTETNRAKVIGLSLNGISQGRIAEHIGIDSKTLRAHYRHELDFGTETLGAMAANHLVRLMRGDGSSAFSAVKYFLSCRCHWVEKTWDAVGIELPELKSVQDAERALAAIFAGVTSGKLPPDQAAALSAIVDRFIKAAELGALESRMNAIEKVDAPQPPEGRAYDA